MKPPSPPRAAEAALPRDVGAFTLVRELGRGGMGVVYEARERASGRSVALKVLATELRFSEEAFERFRRESRLAAAISDRHCVFVYGAHEVEGSPAIAMELCAGETLDQKLARHEEIPIHTAVRWTLEILEGLEAAHRAGVVHRDVKPSNCFTTADGHVKVGDFGLSRSLESDVSLTQSGAFLGSPLYAAPEQIRGRDVDLRSDLYSCAATLYALLTGRPPFTGGNVGEVLARILSEAPPSPRALRRAIPRDLEKVVLRGMDRDPKRRFQDHASFRAALSPFATPVREPAGLKRRFAAYLVDSAAMSVVSVVVMGTLSHYGIVRFDAERAWLFASWWQTLLVSSLPLVWFTLLEGWLGAGPGKWLLGLRVVSVTAQQPSFARAALRCLVFYGPSLLVGVWVSEMRVDQRAHTSVNVSVPGLIALAYCATMRRANGYRAVHDFASGTAVVQKSSPLARLIRRPAPSAQLKASTVFPATIGPYRVEGLVGASGDGQVLSAVDPDLGRPVWIHVRKNGSAAADESRRALARSARLRWLDSVTLDDAHCEVSESPGGVSLVEWAQTAPPVEWPTAQRFLTGLTDELCIAASERTDAARYSLAQVWIDRAWEPRLLDFAMGDEVPEPVPARELCEQVARRLLLPDRGTARELPVDLPAHAETTVRRLLGSAERFARIEDARGALSQLGERASALTRSTRIAQLFFGSSLALMLVVLSLALAVWILPLVARSVEGWIAIEQLVLHRQALTAAGDPSHALSPVEVEAREIVGAWALASMIGPALLQQKQQDGSGDFAEVAREVAKRHPAPSPADVERARAVQRSRASADDARKLNEIADIGRNILALGPFFVVAGWGVFATLSAFLFQGGLTLRLCGIRVRSRRGALASRLRTLVRCLITWVPFALGYAAAGYSIVDGAPATGWPIMALTGLVHVVAIAFALWQPTTSLQDRLARTTLVPR